MSEWDTSKEAFIQWKGTDVCMDLHCPKCGYHNHYDGFFGYAVECCKCKAVWKMNCYVTFREADPAIEDDQYWIEHPIRDEYDPEEDDSQANPEAKS
jgi:hypothetical protein